ncbi:MAG: hypothetical protein AAF235_11370, partial [Planctomycetota bacterium]
LESRIARDQRVVALTPGIGEPMIEAAEGMDPFALPDTDRRAVAFPLPAQRGVVVAIIRGFRPATIDIVRQSVDQLVSTDLARELVDRRESLGDAWPFSYASLAARNQFRSTDQAMPEEAATDDADEAERDTDVPAEVPDDGGDETGNDNGADE